MNKRNLAVFCPNVKRRHFTCFFVWNNTPCFQKTPDKIMCFYMRSFAFFCYVFCNACLACGGHAYQTNNRFCGHVANLVLSNLSLSRYQEQTGPNNTCLSQGKYRQLGANYQSNCQPEGRDRLLQPNPARQAIQKNTLPRRSLVL